MMVHVLQREGRTWLRGPLREVPLHAQSALVAGWLLEHGPVRGTKELTEFLRESGYPFVCCDSTRSAIWYLRRAALRAGCPMIARRGRYGWEREALDVEALDRRLAELVQEVQRLEDLRAELLEDKAVCA